jgi:group I intron endonuclease
MGYIYKITNKTDGKMYVGQTIQMLEERWKQHRRMKGNCLYLRRAFEKYGIDNFVFEMICDCSNEELDKFEKQYMIEFNSMVPNGYNLREGGNGGRHHEETKRKISASLKGRTDFERCDWTGKHHSEETKKKISDALKGRTDIIRGLGQDWTGKHHSEESKQKMSDSHNKRINQYDLNNNFIKTFDSITNAAKETNNNRQSIGKCCNNKYKTAGGFIWRFDNN